MTCTFSPHPTWVTSLREVLPEQRNVSVSLANLKGSPYLGLIRMLLASGVDVRLTVTGRSMRPFLRGGERVTLRMHPPERLLTGDLIFFLDRHDAPVLHRLIARKTGTAGIAFITKGDGLAHRDEPIAGNQIWGKVVRIERAEGRKTIDLLSPRWISTNFFLACRGRFRAMLASPLLKMPDRGRWLDHL